VEDGAVLVEHENGSAFGHAPLEGVRSVRVVPLSRGSHHASASGWQVALARADGDVLLGQPLGDWRSAREVARMVCEQTKLPLDKLTEALFSRVGRISL
jgi:hypothetical protein